MKMLNDVVLKATPSSIELFKNLFIEAIRSHLGNEITVAKLIDFAAVNKFTDVQFTIIDIMPRLDVMFLIYTLVVYFRDMAQLSKNIKYVDVKTGKILLSKTANQLEVF